MHSYASLHDLSQRAEIEANAIDTLQSSGKNAAMASASQPEGPILAACYPMDLPADKEPRAEPPCEREAVRPALRRVANATSSSDLDA